LPHGGENIGEAGPGDGEAHARLAGGPRIAIGHEACALFVAGQDMANTGAGQGAVHLDVVYAGNAEDRVDAIGFQQADKCFACREFGSYAHLWFSRFGEMSLRSSPCATTLSGMGLPRMMDAAVSDSAGEDWMP
jgi:hypothetical protein